MFNLHNKVDFMSEKLIGLLIVAVVAMLAISYFTKTKVYPINITTTTLQTSTSLPLLTSTTIPSITETRNATIFVPAVDNEGNGIALPLIVEVRPGEGRVLTNINEVLVWWVSTQESIQTAKRVAQNITNSDLSKVDLIYTLETNATLIEGPSAGAALTIATVAALENKGLNSSVMITGTINSDGTIGPIGGVVAKAKAAKDLGAVLFLIPSGQGTQITYVPETKCEKLGRVTYCSTEYKKQTTSLLTESGIEVKEVSNINEALKYFLI